MKKLFLFLILGLGLMINTNAQTQPSEVVILNEKGAKFSEGERMDFKNAKVVIPSKTKLKVIRMESITTEESEGDEEIFYYYFVQYNGKEGWIKAIDTNFAQIDY